LDCTEEVGAERAAAEEPVAEGDPLAGS
jgi:hypothetical protein